MLNRDKLCYLGIDLHSRMRRRIVVMCNWIAFFVGMGALDAALNNQSFSTEHPEISMCITAVYVFLFYLLSVFREGGSVRPFHLPTRSLSGFKGEFVLLSSLDDWARYRYGAALDALPEEQQQDVLRRYRVGQYYFPADKSCSPEGLDEREMMVRDRASAGALKLVVIFCIACAGSLTGSNFAHLRPGNIMASFLTIVFVAMAGPASVILWTEPDPKQGREPLLAPAA